MMKGFLGAGDKTAAKQSLSAQGASNQTPSLWARMAPKSRSSSGADVELTAQETADKSSNGLSPRSSQRHIARASMNTVSTDELFGSTDELLDEKIEDYINDQYINDQEDSASEYSDGNPGEWGASKRCMWRGKRAFALHSLRTHSPLSHTHYI
jgi:hypothetical protein